MHEPHDPITLLDALAGGGEDFDPDSPAARAMLERILASGHDGGGGAAGRVARRRWSRRRRLGLAAVPAALAVVALAVIPSLGGGSRTGVAEAAVLSRAA